jgi:ParB-like nuclease family protein
MKDLEAVTVDIYSIHLDPENARVHSREQLEYIAASLKRFGQQKPIVVGLGKVIVAGNGTYEAAKEILGWDSISVVFSDLTAEEARAYSLADNQLATQSDWDLDSLSKHIKDLSDWNPMQDWSAIGFDEGLIEPLLEATTEEETTNALQDFLGGDAEAESKPEMGKPIKVTFEQREIIGEAVNILRLQEEDFRMSEGRALELICADFLAGIIQKRDEEMETSEADAPF